MRAVVLGAGRVGGLIARELARRDCGPVRAVDAREAPLHPLGAAGIETRVADLADPAAVRAAVADADVAVSAVPGALGFRTLETLIDAGVPTVDIAFAPEDTLALDERARAAGVAVVVDCGVAPGISNLMVGRSVAALDETRSVRILVGGLPAEPDGVWDYRAVFSPADVIEEYVRPCRMRVAGRDVVVEALTGVEPVEFAGVGTLEAFNTDGLRSLLATIPAPTMVEKTLRWPGHAAKARALREAGFFDPAPVRPGEPGSSPLALSVRLLSDAWALRPGETEITVMRVEVEGIRNARDAREAWDLLDRTEAATGVTSMARTTGFPAVAMAGIVGEGAIEAGVWPPESLSGEVAERVLEEVKGSGVGIVRRVE